VAETTGLDEELTYPDPETVSNLLVRIIAGVLGLIWICWIITCVRRGRFPGSAGFRRDYIYRGHDGVGFWLIAIFYGGLGVAIVIAAIVNK
jgi:hypothetical protein